MSIFVPNKIDDPNQAIEYCKILKRRELDLENLIGSDPNTALWYAANIMKGRFPAGEKAMATDAFIAAQYAATVINERFPEAEKTIAESSYRLSYYQKFRDSFPLRKSIHTEHQLEDLDEILVYVRISRARFKRGELQLLIEAKKDASKIPLLIEYYVYTEHRNDEFEKEIAKYPIYSLNYALELKKRFPAGEKTIANGRDANAAAKYATSVIKGPFEEAEKLISSNAKASYVYARDALRESFPLGEPEIAKHAPIAYMYASHVLKKPFPQAERAIAKRSNIAFLYAVNILHDRFRLGERSIFRDQKFTMQYRKFLKTLSQLRLATICPNCYKLNIVFIDRKTHKCENCVSEFDLDENCTRKVKVKKR